MLLLKTKIIFELGNVHERCPMFLGFFLEKSFAPNVGLIRDFLIDGRRSLIWDVRLGV